MRPWVAFDIEVSGTEPLFALQPWRLRQGTAWITTAAYARKNKAGEIVTDGVIKPSKEWIAAVLQRAIDGDMYVVTWNGIYDIAWLIALGLEDLVHRVRWLDAMLLWKFLDISPTFSDREHTYALKGPKGAVGTFCPDMLGYDDEVDYHDQSYENLFNLLTYNKHDTAATLIAAEAIWAKLGKGNGDFRRAAALVEAACLPMMAAANVAGMHVDRPAVKALYIKLSATVNKMEAALAPHGVTEKVIRSWQQLGKKIYDEWGLPPITGPNGNRTTNKDALTQLVVEDDRVALLMAYREALNLRGKFIGSIVKSCEYNGDRVTRPQIVPFGTYTGRCTYNSTQGKNKAERHVGFPLHQMKRLAEFRAMVKAPPEDEIAPEGYEIVEFDAAGQEFRWMAIYSGDETMLALCKPGEDPHSFMAARIYGGDYQEVIKASKEKGSLASKWRAGGKVANFSLQYRTSAKTLRVRARTDHGLIMSEQEAITIHTTYQRTYTKVPRYWSSQIQQGMKLGYAETMAGRRVKVIGNWAGSQAYPMQQTMINYPIQGTGGDQKLLALKIMKDRLHEFDARFAWDLHDGIYFYVPKNKAMRFAVEMRQALDDLPYEQAWGFKSPIPLTWDAKIGPSWGALSEIKD